MTSPPPPTQTLPELWPRLGWLILVVAVAIRLWLLGAEGLWFDEVMQVSRAAGNGFFELWSRIPPDKPPLAFYALWPLAKLSLDERWLRLPSLLFGVLGVAGVVVLTQSLAPARPRVALAAGMLAAFSPLAVKLSSEVLPYSAATAWLCATYAAAIHWQRSGARGPLRGLFAASALALWTSYQAAAALLPLALTALAWALVRRDRRPLAVAGAVLAAALTTLPLWPRMLSSTLPETHWAPGSFLTDTIPLVLGGLSAGFDGAPTQFAWIGFAFLALVGLVAALGGRQPRLPRIWLAGWLGLGLALLCAAAYARQHWVAVRYLLLFVPPWLAFAALGADALVQRIASEDRWRAVALAVVCGGLIATTLPTLAESRSARLDFRGLAGELEDLAEPGDLVLFQHRLDEVPYVYYRRIRDSRPPPSVSLQQGLSENPRARARIERAERIWIPGIAYHWLPMSPDVREIFLPRGRESSRRGPIPLRIDEPEEILDALWPERSPRPEP
jgi:hypothetical protein